MPLIVGVGLYIIRFGGRFREQYRTSHETLKEAFDVNALPPEDPISMISLAVHTETVTIPPGAVCAGQTLGGLDLRKRTGAAVISITSRRSGLNVSPGRDTILNVGDVLIVVGADPEIERALVLLTQRV